MEHSLRAFWIIVAALRRYGEFSFEITAPCANALTWKRIVRNENNVESDFVSRLDRIKKTDRIALARIPVLSFYLSLLSLPLSLFLSVRARTRVNTLETHKPWEPSHIRCINLAGVSCRRCLDLHVGDGGDVETARGEGGGGEGGGGRARQRGTHPEWHDKRVPPGRWSGGQLVNGH